MSRSVQPAGKASAVIVISGAMVASLALPATAAKPTVKPQTSARVTISAPAAAQAPLAARTFGTIGFVGAAKPVALPVVRRSTGIAVSRSVTRAETVQEDPAKAPEAQTGGLLGLAGGLAGIYYVYGGTTPDGFDCSGYTQYVFGKAGISLPRTAEEQRQAATPVSDPQPGDLIFFGIPAHHVGIYAGNGMMWDSPETGSTVGLHSSRTGATFGRV
jgi:cell wall-associated NlpC family hydrolase